MFTGHTGLTRILRAGKIPLPLIQKYFNKWLSTAYDLFGTDHSSSAHWSYVWGLKGRYDEHEATVPAQKEKLKSIKTGKRLQLDQPRRQTAIDLAHPEVDHQKIRMRGLVRYL